MMNSNVILLLNLLRLQKVGELKQEVREDHIRRIRQLSEVADDLNLKYGEVWHNKYITK